MGRLKFFAIAISLFITFTACSDNDGLQDITFNILEIEDVLTNDEVSLGDTLNIDVMFQFDSSCELFAGFNATGEGLVRNIVVVGKQFDTACSGEESMATETLVFEPQNAGEYNFRFVTETDGDGGNVSFLERTITVNN